MPKTISGFTFAKNTKRLQRSFSPKIVKFWAKCIEEYCSRFRSRFKYTDVPYDYTERANIGFVSIAAWKAGYLTIEEYTEWKGGERNGRSGRVDLAIMGSEELVIEAKMKWASPENLSNCAKQTLESALSAMEKSYVPEPGELKVKRAAIAFVVLRVSHDDPSVIRTAIDDAKKVESDVCAWVFPAQTRSLDCSDEGASRKRFVPGVFLFLKHESHKRT